MRIVVIICVLLLATDVVAQIGTPHSGIGKCPNGQVVNALMANAPPQCGGGGSTTDAVLPTIGTNTNAQNSGGANITLNKPASVISGHTMIAAIAMQSTVTATPPSGWTLIRSDACSGHSISSYYKVAGGSEPSSYTWTFAGTYSAAGLIDVGVTAANPVDVISPIECGGSLAALTTTTQAENVVMFAGSNISSGMGFTPGAVQVAVPTLGGEAFSLGTLVSNYPATPSVTVTGGGGTEEAQMIAIAPASTYTSRPVLQGDSYAELTKLRGTVSSDDSIGNFNIDGRFNVKNPIYGAIGNGVADDTTAIAAAYTAACTAAVAASRGETVWFPAGTYATSFSIISNCPEPITFKGESESTSIIRSGGGLFPLIMHEGASYLASIVASGAITAASLATGSGTSLNWGANSQQFYDLKDAQSGNSSTGWNNAHPLNGATALSVEGFFNYAGGGSGTIYVMQSAGDDLGLPNLGGALQLFLIPGSPNTLEACITTTGSGSVCTARSGSFTAGTTYEFEYSFDGSTLRLFAGTPGSTTSLIGSASATGTIVEAPSETFALGDGGSGLGIGGIQFQTANHWIGQLDSIRISSVARHTSTYTAPTAKFASDGSTLVLLNNLAQSDTLLQVTNVVSLSASTPVWIPLHSYAIAGGNIHASFVNLGLQGGNYNLLGVDVLYTTLDHISGGGASHNSIRIEYTSYGTRIEHLTITPTAFGEAGLVMSDSSLVNLSWLFETGGYYGMELEDGEGVYSMLFMNPQSNAAAVIDMSCSVIFGSYSIHELQIDFESGGTPIPAKIWGQGAFQFYGGDFQYDPSVNALQVAPNASALNLSLFGGQVAILGSPTNPLISWKGSNPPQTPATWINPVVNGKPLSTATIPLSDNVAYAQAISDVLIPPLKTVSTLPACNAAATGWVVQLSDCNANCTSYLGTTFTGSGSTRSTVQCNGTNWELH